MSSSKDQELVNLSTKDAIFLKNILHNLLSSGAKVRMIELSWSWAIEDLYSLPSEDRCTLTGQAVHSVCYGLSEPNVNLS